MRIADRTVLSWALYDWANSVFATTVMAGFFPVFFKEYWSAGASATVGTFRLGVANAGASVVILLLAPVLGAIADAGGARKRFLAFFATLGIVMSAGLYLVAHGAWVLAAVVYALAVIGYSGANVFYDALLVEVATPDHYHRVSALGYALGYLGGGLLLALNVVMVQRPAWFGLTDAAQAVRIAFPLVAVWWAVFSVPLLRNVREHRTRPMRGAGHSVRRGLKQLAETLRHVRRLRFVGQFLVAYWLYIDGVDTVVRMAVNYGLELGFHAGDLLLALLVTQFVGFPAAIVFGRLGQRWGPRASIFVAIGVYMLVLVWAARMRDTTDFYGIAVAIGLVQGGIQSLSRSLYARLIPPDKAAEFFGFYNMLGKFAAVLGPLLMGWVGWATGSPRLSILSLVSLFLAGGLALWFVDEEAGRLEAARL
ncbi:MAG: MFS transporter [Chromatiales bacterium 21-64-14]|nr:MAG: MFS transporter [Chromatiales bacterium 21-64-14]HQU14781.1 MFS transporter [Gammaproteobacteria bacterium]